MITPSPAYPEYITRVRHVHLESDRIRADVAGPGPHRADPALPITRSRKARYQCRRNKKDGSLNGNRPSHRRPDKPIQEEVVEAAGIEPASETDLSIAPTCFFPDLILAPRSTQGIGSPQR